MRRHTLGFQEKEFKILIPLKLLFYIHGLLTPWTAARQASLSITNSRSSLKLMSIESVMPSNHPLLCCPLLLLYSIFPSIRVFSNEQSIKKKKSSLILQSKDDHCKYLEYNPSRLLCIATSRTVSVYIHLYFSTDTSLTLLGFALMLQLDHLLKAHSDRLESVLYRQINTLSVAWYLSNRSGVHLSMLGRVCVFATYQCWFFKTYSIIFMTSEHLVVGMVMP